MNRDKRRKRTRVVTVGSVRIGGDNPIAIQSMTNTPTGDVAATVEQCSALARAGSEILRITVNTPEAARAVPEIIRQLRDRGITAPMVGDFHFNGHKLLKEYPEAAEALDKFRINPGTLGGSQQSREHFETMINIARDLNKPVRIGVNWGSLDQALLKRMMDENAASSAPLSGEEVLRNALVASCLESEERAIALGLGEDAVVLSAKVSRVPDLIALYRELSQKSTSPLHLGLTEAGMGEKGIVASALGIGILLAEGIGDTIRVSLTPRPGEDRAREVAVCRQILQSLGLRSFTPQVTSCPGCGRTTSTLFQALAVKVERHVEASIERWREIFPGVENLTIAVMGCVVNGPGESRHADIGISLPGTGEEPRAPVYIDGKHAVTLSGPDLADQFITLLEEYVGVGGRS